MAQPTGVASVFRADMVEESDFFDWTEKQHWDIKASSEKLQHYMTILVSPGGVVEILGTPLLSILEAKSSHEKWASIFYKQGSLATIIAGNTPPWGPELMAKASLVEAGFELITTIYENADAESSRVNDEFSRWKIITAHFLTTDIGDNFNCLTAYISLTEEDARQARLSVALRTKCLGPRETMEYYSNRDHMFFF